MFLFFLIFPSSIPRIKTNSNKSSNNKMDLCSLNEDGHISDRVFPSVDWACQRLLAAQKPSPSSKVTFCTLWRWASESQSLSAKCKLTCLQTQILSFLPQFLHLESKDIIIAILNRVLRNKCLEDYLVH